MSSDFLGFGGLAIGTVGTVLMTKEVVKAMKNTSRPTRRMPPRRMKSKPMKKSNKRYSISNLAGF